MSAEGPLSHLKPPYYAVIFTSLHSTESYEEYEKMAQRMEQLAQAQEGYLGIESATPDDPAKTRITVSYWRDLAAIHNWKKQAEHLVAQEQGKSVWYRRYQIRICLVEREYGFAADH